MYNGKISVNNITSDKPLIIKRTYQDGKLPRGVLLMIDNEAGWQAANQGAIQAEFSYDQGKSKDIFQPKTH